MAPEQVPVADVRIGEIILRCVWFIERDDSPLRDDLGIPGGHATASLHSKNEQPVIGSMRTPIGVVAPAMEFPGSKDINRSMWCFLHESVIVAR